jgi:hypothetical protein
MTQETVYKAEEKAKMQEGRAWAAWLLIGTGAALLVAGLFDLHLMDYLWPGFIIVPGLLLMLPAYKSTALEQSKLAFFAIPGAVMVATGVLLGVMNLFNYFGAWVYAWPLLLAAAAGGVLYITRFDENADLERRAYKFIRTMGMIVLGMAFFFEILVFEHFNPLLSLGMIVLGLYMLRQERQKTLV